MMCGLNGEDFLDSLISCSVVFCSAGFETLAEAAYLGKPLQVVPTENHFEQYCNAIDLERSGLGNRIKSIEYFDIIHGQANNDKLDSFKSWVNEAGKIILGLL